MGSGLQYLVNLWIEIEPTDKLEPGGKTNPYGDLKGFRAKFNLVKSRNSEGGKSTTMIFNQREGFDIDLSTFEFLKNVGAVKGAGIGLYLENLPDKKFRMSLLKEKLATDADFRGAFDALAKFYLDESVSESSKTVRAEVEEPEEQVLLEETQSVVETSEVVTNDVLEDIE